MKILLLAVSLALPAAAQDAPVSGYDFLLPETQALQDDDFANPGMLWVEAGQRLWDQTDPGPSCASCHGGVEPMRGVGTHYPKWSEAADRIVTMEDQINQCRTQRQHGAPYSDGSEALLGLTALIMHQSRGMPLYVATDGPAAGAFARGESYYNTTRGQLDLSCANCHVENAGNQLRGEVISQGQVNGFPIYRQLWQDMGSLDRMIRWCHDAVRAEAPEAGSEDMLALILYLYARGNGLPIETPAVRR